MWTAKGTLVFTSIGLGMGDEGHPLVDFFTVAPITKTLAR